MKTTICKASALTCFRIIAILLGRLRMTIGEALDAFRHIIGEMYSHRRSRTPLATKYAHEPFEETMKRIVAKYCPDHGSQCDGLDPFDDPDDDVDGSDLLSWKEAVKKEPCQT